MADGFEPYHVPQQSRRDKLRETTTTNHHLHSYGVSSPLFPALYDPCLLPSDLINLHRQSYNLGVKEESNFMGFVPGLNLASSSSTIPTNQIQPMFADPQLTIQESFPYYRASGFDNYGGKDHQTLSLELNLQSCDDSEVYSNVNNKITTGYVVAGNGSGCVDMARSAVPLGPYTGYALVLNGSRFLRPAQLLMEELCDVSRGVYGDRNGTNPGLMDPPPFDGAVVDEALSCSIDAGEQTRTKSGMISMLNEAYKRYRMYYQQMQEIVASFESVAGLSNAAPFANLALRALTRHFRSLKMAINDQLLTASKSQTKVINYDKNESELVVGSGKVHYGGTRSFQHAGFSEQPVVWRPQRGLPERAVTVLRAWLFEHFLHPYPTDTDKMMLAKQTGLSRNQVSNWFINARVRLWKPMVEEIHTLETHQGKKHSQREELSINRVNDNTPTSPSINQSDNASTSMQRLGEFPMKRTREDVMETSRSREIPLRFAYESLSNDQHLGDGMNNASSSGGVSLTLGLHQNGMGLSESYPMNAARRFGLDSHGDGYALSGYVTQGRQFGRDIIG